MIDRSSPTLNDIIAAHERISPFVHRTPILTSESLDKLAACSLFFKCENFQKIGAFKIRGALNAVLTSTDASLSKGIATHSSGNHAQAIALAARETGLKAHIIMPRNSSKVKVAAVNAYGGEITFCENNIDSRQSTLDELIRKTGAKFIHPYNCMEVITGQATVAKELLEDVEGLDIVIAPIGGGGLMSGTCLSTHYLSQFTEVIGSEPAEADDAFRSLKAGSIQGNLTTNTIADGLKTPLGDLTFSIIRSYVSRIITVSERDIISAMRLIWERMKIIAEPSGAVPLAAILKSPDVFRNKRVGLIITGGNVELGNLPFDI